MDRALGHGFVGQPVNMLKQQKPDRKPPLDPGPALLAVERRDLAVDPVPVDLLRQLRQLVLEVDDLVEPFAEKRLSPHSGR